jgi:hypothetical protein
VTESPRQLAEVTIQQIASYLATKSWVRDAEIRDVATVWHRGDSEEAEVRHAIVHTGGTLSEKHLGRLQALSERLPLELRHGSLAQATFIQTGRVVANMQVILGLRHWA